MKKKSTKRATVYLDENLARYIERWQQRSGTSTFSKAVRYFLALGVRAYIKQRKEEAKDERNG